MKWVISFVINIVLCHCVILEDAFTNNWVQYNYGKFTDYDLISPDQLVAITERSEFLKFELDEGLKLKWKLDLGDFRDTSYIIADSTIITYGDNINVWNKTTGQLIKNLNVRPIQIAWTPHGLVVLNELGDLSIYLDSLKPKFIRSGISSFKSSFYNDTVYILTESSLLKITQQEINETKLNIKYNQITEFKNNLVIFDNTLYNLDEAKIVVNSPNLNIIDPTFSYSFYKDKFVIYKEDTVILEDEFAFSTVEVIDKLVIVSSESERKVIKLEEFFDTLQETYIDFEVYEFNNVNTKDYVFNKQLVSVGVYDKTVDLIVYDLEKDLTTTKNYNLSNYNSQLSLLVDKPESHQTITSIQHLIDEIRDNNLLLRWYRRTIRHLTELGSFVVFKARGIKGNIELENPFGLEKLLVLVDGRQINAIDSLNGKNVWSAPIEDGVVDLLGQDGDIVLVYKDKYLVLSSENGDLVNAVSLKYDKVFQINDQVVFKNGDLITCLGECLSAHIIEQNFNKVRSHEIDENKLVKNWEFTRNNIISVQTKPQNSRTSSIGIPLHDKTVLYKYLNDTVAVITNEDGVRLYILDAFGSVIYSHVHSEVIDLDSIKLVMDDNWIIYTFLSLDPYEQRVVVIDMFENDGIQVSSKAFIFPDRIVKVVPTYTRFGISIKSLLVLTQDGDLLELPKYILNSRRIDDHVLKPSDFNDDFRMTPYEPVLPTNYFQILNHQYKLDIDDTNEVLVRDTNLESTSIVALVNNKQIFVTSLQPSMSFDKLKDFDKVKLGVTILGFIIVYVVSNPMILRKKLNNKWIYST